MTGHRLRLDAEGRLEGPLLQSAPLRRIIAMLDTKGEAARLVGGAVRNALIGHPVADMDIATTAEPGEVMRRAKTAGLRVIPTGVAHGTVTVVVEGVPFEVTTLRRDVETDGRHAVVRFSRDFAEDAERRDFTMNALSASLDGCIHDTVGGLPDLAAARVRFIGDPDQRIAEDHLRLLRFFRFHASYGSGPPDPPGLAAATRHRDALARLSRERIRAELLKLLAASGAVAAVAAMDAAGIATLLLDGPADPERLARLVAAEVRMGLDPDPLLRLAALGLAQADDAVRLRRAFRLSNEETGRLAAAATARQQLDPRHAPPEAACLALLFDCGTRTAVDALMLAMADAAGGADAAWEAALRTLQSRPPPLLPVGGADVMARGIADGRRVGAVLKLFQAGWIRAGFPADPATLAALLDDAVAAQSRAS